MKPADHFHGSDLEKIEQYYHIKKEEIISFSANVNPLGISNKLRETLADQIQVITTYPDREYLKLRQAIATYVGSDVQNIMTGSGSTELISLFIQIQQPKTALLLGPTYSEYEREILISGGKTHYFHLPEEQEFNLDITMLEKALTADTDLLILCNPNNPTSSVIERPVMRQILDLCKQLGIYVMVDETYVEFSDQIELVTAVPLAEYYNNLIILRGTSKFFAAPGLRLGYAVCGNEDLLREMKKRQNPWTINSLAEVAGQIMFSDHDYIKATKELIHSERNRIIKRLKQCQNIKVYPSHSNFVLVKILSPLITSKMLFEAAIKEGLMIRDCSTFPFLNHQYFRFCFMLPEQNDRLLDVLLTKLNE